MVWSRCASGFGLVQFVNFSTGDTLLEISVAARPGLELNSPVIIVHMANSY